ncbi:hypothetical protein QBC35DRAFT_484520 [Podospora australis]|uniref:Uncharacterized protein n=1 Tax=Podospora australis TaxID=1536484 RepID=A0AAN6X1D4_9PEZI|nr:hypothetical protein QBC35DRAFT_484520 [Podospora australis]
MNGKAHGITRILHSLWWIFLFPPFSFFLAFIYRVGSFRDICLVAWGVGAVCLGFLLLDTLVIFLLTFFFCCMC